MEILVDLDDVCAHFVPRVLQYWNEDHPDMKKEITDITSWEIASCLGPGGKDFVRSIMRYNHLYEYLDPVEGAVDGMKALLDKGHDVTIVTSVPRSAASAYDGKLQWVRKHMPFFPIDSVFACSKKYRVNGDVLLDDGLHNLIPFNQKTGRAVAFARPWNKSWNGDRVHSWPEFVRYVGSIIVPA